MVQVEGDAIAAALLTTRGQTHGSFAENAVHGQALRALFRDAPAWRTMPEVQREALDNIATKFSRILSGQADFGGHWEDVSGYAELARKACRR
jgi:hypothetical protein